MSSPLPFKAETRQLLNILIHSLYTDRGVFLRELISNASDALTRVNYEMLTNRDVLDPEAELAIWISVDPKENTLTIRDTGVGMNADEMIENLGTIAHSGARAFLEAAQVGENKVSDIIGQFGVGFYSAFMVAESITVTSRSFRLDAQAARWVSSGDETFSVEPAEKNERGTEIVVKLKPDAAEYTQEQTIKQIIKKHSDYVPYPIYLGESKEQANNQTAIWRRQPRQVEEKEYDDFFRQLTLDPFPPLTHTHIAADAPVQLYAVLYVPSSSERGIFSIRKQDGLKLYARKVLIQEYSLDLVPEFFNFVQGVVDSEDLPLNVSRESIQSTRIMAQIKKLLTSRIIESLKTLGQEKPEEYIKFWQEFGRYIRQGVSTSQENHEAILPLLRFHTLSDPQGWCSLDAYVEKMKPDQKDIYYILGDDERSLVHSPHLEVLKRAGYDVFLMTDPFDSFMLLRLTEYKDHSLVNVSSEKFTLPETDQQDESQKTPEASPEVQEKLLAAFRKQLGERVTEVRVTSRLVESPARLVDKEGTLNPEMQRVYRLLNKEYEVPQKVMEINPQHPILTALSTRSEDDPAVALIIEQIYGDALLIEGLHPDPAGMISRIQQLMELALKK